MAVTKGTITNMQSPENIFLPPVDDLENNRINFRNSLKFFQEQLLSNGVSFPSPAPGCRNSNDIYKKSQLHSTKDQNVDVAQDCDELEKNIQSMRACQISIPTVDTILESVRVLRAIQKSQKERGSNWNLDITATTDIAADFNLESEWLHESSTNRWVFQHELQDVAIQASSDFQYERVETDRSPSEEDAALKSGRIFKWPSNTIENKIWVKEQPTPTQLSGEQCSNSEAVADNATTSEELPGSGATRNNGVSTSSASDRGNEESVSAHCVDFSDPAFVSADSKPSITINDVQESTEDGVRTIDPIRQMLKIETYDDFDSPKDFVLSQSHWKDECSPNGSGSLKLDSTDCDSGLGALTSASSSSPNMPSQAFKESWSDTSSSHYASAECSPYQSLSSVFDSSTNQKVSEKNEDLTYELNLNSDVLQNSSDQTDDRLGDEKGLSKMCQKDDLTSNDLISIQEEEDLICEKKKLSQCTWEVNSNCNDQKSNQEQNDIICEKVNSQCIFEANSNSKDHSSDPKEEHIISKKGTNSQYDLVNPIVNCSDNKSTQEGENLNSGKEGISHSNLEVNSLNMKQSSHDSNQKDNAETTTSPEQNEYKNFTLLSLQSEEEKRGIEQDTEHFYSFVSNSTLERVASQSENNSEKDEANSNVSENTDGINQSKNLSTFESSIHSNGKKSSSDKSMVEHLSDEEIERIEKFITASCDIVFIAESLYSIKKSPSDEVFQQVNEVFEEMLYILSDGAFHKHPEDYYLVRIEESVLYISKDSHILLSLNMKYGEVSTGMNNTLKVDNKMGRWIYIKCDFESMLNLKTEIELHCLKHWQNDCLKFVHYPLEHHKRTIIIDLGSISTRAGILMDQPTLPSIFFPTICATNRKTGENIYGVEALHPEVRQHSTISFPCRPSMKITKHTIDIDLLEGLFKKIFKDLQVDPTQYTVLVCLPRNLSISSQSALVKLLLEKLQVKSVSLANQTLLTLYAYDSSTAVVINIGERTEILPVVDGFIVESGASKLPLGGQSAIDLMKHRLAEKHINLSSDIDSCIAQYIIQEVAYVADDYENEIKLSSEYPYLLNKTVTLQSVSSKNSGVKGITLDDARFKVCEGLFDPELWGIDSPGIHHLVIKAIQATGVDVRKKIAQNIYVSGGMTMLPGFVERLNREVLKLSKAKVVPKVFASNYRNHCTYIGACRLASMDVFPQICINLDEFSREGSSVLKKCALCF